VKAILGLWLAVCGVASAQLTPVPPPSTATPSHPFFITKAWIVGGSGDWDSLTLDAAAHQLFISHGPQVQVVDVESGTVVGTVKGMREVHTIVLDQQGQFGYISDGPADVVHVFDRRTFQIVANIPTGPSPRSMALDPATGLLFVIGSQQAGSGGQPANPSPTTRPPSSSSRTPRNGNSGSGSGTPRGPQSTITVIDAERRTQIAQILLQEMLGFAQGDGNGRIYITVPDRDRIIRIDAQAVGSALQGIINDQQAAARRAVKTQQPATQPSQPSQLAARRQADDKPLQLDWTAGQSAAPSADAYPYPLPLNGVCERPRALAVDSTHERLFVACSNFKMVALDAGTGQAVATLPIGPGPDTIGYDPNRGLIFTANGAGDGSLTIIRQDVTDTYSVVQTLPTRQNARTLAIDPSNGAVYLATVITGAVLSNQSGPIKLKAVDGSFQVLVVGN
jgi:DNA-binding beta-propeller fold protein YncE